MPIPPDTEERYDLDQPAPLEFTADGGPVVLGVTRIDVVPAVIVIAEVDVASFGSLRGGGFFGLDRTAEPPEWEPDRPIELTLRLDDEVAHRFDDGEVLVRTMFGPDPTDLRVANSWRALEAMQHVPVPGLDGETTSFGIAADP